MIQWTDVPYTITVKGSVLYIELTQAESGSFIEEAVAKVKVNWLDSNAKRHATKTKVLKVEENLLKGVIGVV